MAWLQGMPNNGIVIKEKEDTINTVFYSAESEVTYSRPYLTVTYSSEEAPLNQGITSNTKYNLVNKATDLCLTSASATDGAAVYQRKGTTNEDPANMNSPVVMPYQQWTLHPIDNQLYYITVGDYTTKCLTAVSTGSGSTVQIGTYDATNQDQQWRVTRNWDGTFTVRKRYTNMSIQSNGIVNDNTIGVKLYGHWINFDFADEWTLVPAALTGSTGSLFCFDVPRGDGEINTTAGMQTITNKLSSYYTSTLYTNSNATVGFQELQARNLFFYTGHGSPGTLNFYTPPSNEPTDLVVTGGVSNSLDLLNSNALANLRLAVLSCCDAGRDYMNDNMTGRLYWLGCHNVLSYFHKTSNYNDGAWNSIFMSEILLKKSIREAKQRADRQVYYDTDYPQVEADYLYGNMNERHDLGDDWYRPCLYLASQQAYEEDFEYSDTLQLSYRLYSDPNYTGDNKVKYTISGYSYTWLKKHTLPLAVRNSEFDVYMAPDGGVYWYLADTNILYAYAPYTSNLSLGETAVNPTLAFLKAAQFIDACGYVINNSNWDITMSNEYSKTCTIKIKNKNNSDNFLAFWFQADANGTIYMIDFMSNYQQ